MIKIKTIGRIPTQEELARITQQTKVMPFRICYAGEGGDTWKVLRQEETYSDKSVGNREITTLQRSISEIAKLIGAEPINLIHIGPGEGIEIPVLFERIKPTNKAVYTGVDISKEMLVNTARLQSAQLKGVKPLWYQTDIETEGNLELVAEETRKQGAKRNLVCLLGQGVISSNEKSWENISQCLKSGDFFYLTIEGDDIARRDEICASYDLPFVRGLISIGLRRAGYDTRKGSFKTSFNPKKSRAEVHFTTGYRGDILSLTSYKPTPKNLQKRLIRQGFEIKHLKFYKDLHTFAVLCQKRNH
ncbi:MAG: L-histidine N(alpha)-methyltransferase [Candidatus Pacearchaeota archaeon]|nr:L-histidine N(alpha)-methyltransferase [Candidatus Pacearchaeota archaeon]